MVPIELKRMLTCGKDFCLLDVLVDNEQAAESLGMNSIGPDGGHTNG